MSKSFADVMASKKNGRRKVTETVCLSPDLDIEMLALQHELAEAKAAETMTTADGAQSPRRIGGGGRQRAILQRMDALIKGNPESFYDITLEAVTPAEWSQFRAQHPPRDGVRDDRGAYNVDTFPAAALALCMTDPEPTDEVIEFLVGTLSPGELKNLGGLVWTLHEGVRSTPKAETISSILAGRVTG